MRSLSLLPLVLLLSAAFLPAQDTEKSKHWHQWRGPDNTGVSRTATPPLEWSEQKNLRWKAEIKGGATSSPAVWENRVFVTTAINTGVVDPTKTSPEDQPERIFGIRHPNTHYEMVVLCYDRHTGMQLWRKVARNLVPHEGHHRDASFASASPFCDGERLYCWFGSAGLYAFSLDGEKLWERDLGQVKMGASLGEGSSPVVHNGRLVLVRDHAGPSSIHCLDASTGQTIWKKDRDEKNAWATPAITEHAGRVQVITSASNAVRSYDLENGDLIWSATGLTGNCTPVPIVHGDTVYCMSGYQGSALLAIPITGKGDVTDSIRWRGTKGTPYVPSAILYDDRLLFTQSNQPILTSVKASDGTRLIERERVPDLGDIYASPVGAQDRIYFAGRKGTTVVIDKGDQFKVLAVNDLDDNFHASPALAGKQLFLRGKRFLYCLEEGATPPPATTSSAPKKEAAPNKESPDLARVRKVLEAVAKREIPKEYPGGGKDHQAYVEKVMKSFSQQQMARLGGLWKAQQAMFPDMKNKGNSFIRILDYVRSTPDGPAKSPDEIAPAKPNAAQAHGNPHIKKHGKAEITREPGFPVGKKGTVAGKVVDESGAPMGGVMISAFDDQRRQSVSVFSQLDGTFRLDDLHDASFRLRSRLPGQRDHWTEDVKLGATDLRVAMAPAEGEELEDQRPATSAFAQLKFDSPRDRLNFKMMCSYCHQIGTPAFRAPEKPVDWETMIRRMDGFGGLYPHTRETIVKRIIDTYKDDGVDSWPAYVPPPAPKGMVTQAKITSWEMGEPYVGSFHDLEVGDDGLAYVVHIGKQYTATLHPETAERIYYRLPRGSHGPHSIEPDNHGDMWLTLCVSGEMAKFDLKTEEYTILSSAEPPAARGSWPHTLRTDPKDPESYVWYTDAGRNSVFRLHPRTLERKEYHLLEAGQVKAGGKGESRGITPYGLDFSPVDGSIWYSKLNGNRIGRIDPKASDGAIEEWNPPFRGPRRLHVAPDGIVWVPGFGSGVFGKFDPKSEKWTTYPLPDYINQIPYALNVAPDGMVWICGTGNDTLYRFNPKTEYLVEFPLPFRVSYTREIEFDKHGAIWTSTSGPARHMENACGTIIRIELPDDVEESGGQKLTPIVLSEEEQGIMSQAQKQERTAQLGALLAKIEARALPKDYDGKNHQQYVDRVLASIEPERRARVGQLFKQRRAAPAKMENAGHSFIRILDYVAKGGSATEIPAEPGPGTASGKSGESIEKKTGVHRLDNPNRSPFDVFAYVNRLPDKPRTGETPHQFAGRIHGRLANQEGRVLLKLPIGMDRTAYDGFKTFLGSEGNAQVTNCAACHAPPAFGAGTGATLRNRKWSAADYQKILRGKMAKATAGDADYAGLKITEADFAPLYVFQQSLTDLDDKVFRERVLSAEVVDVTAPATPADPSATGPALTGTVRFEGPRPKPNRLPIDEATRKLYTETNTELPRDQSLLVGENGGLANVFVYVKSPVPGIYPVPAEPALLDQQKSIFLPRVQGLRVGQPLMMKNGDPFIHNVRSLSRKNRPFNVAQPADSEDRKAAFEKAEGPITVKCDFHPWMTAHFWVLDHPFHAVTDHEGHFTIPNLPHGEHTLAAWHEKLGKQELKVVVSKAAKPEPPVFRFRPAK